MALTAELVTIDCHDSDALVSFWTAACDYVVTYESGSGDYVVLGPAKAPENAPAGSARPRIGIQTVPEPRVGKNRVHIDFATSSPLADEVARLVSLGASVVAEHSVPGVSWTVMADPEGTVFCVSSGSDG